MRGSLRPACALVLLSGVAHAQRAPERADALFAQGKADMAAGRYGAACAAFAESNELDPSEGTLLALGLCHEQDGKLVKAFAELRDVYASASASGRSDRQRVALAALGRVQPRVGRVVVRPPAEGCTSLRLDEDAIRGGDLEVPVEPGTHRVRCARKAPWESKVDVPAGALKVVVVPAPAPPPVALAPPPSSARTTAGWTVGAAGVLSLAAGTFFGIRAFNQWDAVQEKCLPSSCTDPSARNDADAASTSAMVSNITLVAGAVLVGAGIYLLVTGRSQPATTARAW